MSYITIYLANFWFQSQVAGTIDKGRYKMRLLCVIGMIGCLFCIGFCGKCPKCNKNVQEIKNKFLAAC